jgi:hypothetical protein
MAPNPPIHLKGLKDLSGVGVEAIAFYFSVSSGTPGQAQ